MKKIFITSLCFIAYLQASVQTSLIDIYRQKGLSEVQKQIELSLQDPSYWKEHLKDKNTTIGFYEFDTPVILVNKELKTIKLYKWKDYNQSFLSRDDVIVGKMGDKQKEGDLKTPVGVYEIQKRFTPQDPFYGPLAFSLSYPNTLDKLQNKNGHGIWIHGFPLDEKQREDMTKGCIALKNDALVEFDKKLNTNKGIVIISEKKKISVKKDTISYALAQLFAWKNAWKENNLKSYLSFYDESFTRFDGKNKKEFAKYKTSIFQKREKKTITFKNIAIIPHPDTKEDNIFRISFDEVYKTASYSFVGKKELYVKMEDDKMKILVEK